MKIAFWSNVHGQTGTTSNLLAIAILSTLQYKIKMFLAQSHFTLNNLEAPFLTISDLDKKEYFMDVGIDALTRAIKSTYLDNQIIENSTLSFINKQLVLLPGTVKSNRNLYEEDLSKTIVGILQVIDRYYDFVLMDVNSGNCSLSKKILQNVDLIVVNLRQNITVLKDYEQNYDFINKKILYLLGNYNPNSRYSITNLKKQFSFLRGRNVGVIPYNTEFMDAGAEGNIISYFIKNMNCEKEDPNHYFIEEVKNAVNLILSSMAVERRRIEWLI